MNPFDFNDAPPLKLIDTADHTARLDRLREALQQSAPELTAAIFPRAAIRGGEARVGSTDGEPGESLSITLTGNRAGLWYDHATGEGGDLIDLWCATRGYGKADFLTAVDELESWCGLSAVKKPRPFTAVAKVASERAKAPPAPERKPLGPPAASWHYLSPDGVVLAIVRRYNLDAVDEKTGKQKKTFLPFKANGQPGMPDPRPLYRLPEIRTAETVVFVEGEKCADALASVGIESTCIMGGSNTLLEKADLSPLAGKRVLLWPDNDGEGKTEAKSFVGQKFMARLSEALTAIGCTVETLTIPAGKPPTWDAADAVAEGEDVPAILNRPAAVEPKVDGQRKRLPILSRSQLRDRKPPEYLIEDVITERSIVSVYGPSGSLKSFVAIDMGMSVAHGLAWHGKETKRGPVVYVTGEGTDQIGQRLDAWDAARETADDAPFHLIPLGVPISDPTWVANLIADIAAEQIQPVMIWLDTLARTFGAGDENSQKDMNAYVRGVDTLRDAFGCVVGIVHHTGKDGDKGLRGSSALYAAMDTVIRTERDGLAVTLRNQQPHGKQKDGAEFEDIALAARIITLKSVDKKGRALTSLALFPGEKTERQAGEPDAKPTAAGGNQAAALAVLKRAKGEPMGLVRLSTMIRKDNGTTAAVLAKLVEKGLAIEVGEEGARRWVLA